MWLSVHYREDSMSSSKRLMESVWHGTRTVSISVGILRHRARMFKGGKAAISVDSINIAS